MNENEKKLTKTQSLLDFVYDVGSSPTDVREYLEERNLNFEIVVEEGLDFIASVQIKARRELAMEKREKMKVQYGEFVATITTKTREEILRFIYGSKVQISFRNYKYEEMSDEELRKIAAEIVFLQNSQIEKG